MLNCYRAACLRWLVHVWTSDSHLRLMAAILFLSQRDGDIPPLQPGQSSEWSDRGTDQRWTVR